MKRQSEPLSEEENLAQKEAQQQANSAVDTSTGSSTQARGPQGCDEGAGPDLGHEALRSDHPSTTESLHRTKEPLHLRLTSLDSSSTME
jgi:hypothetical protein